MPPPSPTPPRPSVLDDGAPGETLGDDHGRGASHPFDVACLGEVKETCVCFTFVASKSAVFNTASGSLKFYNVLTISNHPSELTPAPWIVLAVRSSLKSLRKSRLTKDQFVWLGRQDAIFDLLVPEEKVIDAPKSMAEANRMLAMSAYDNLDYMERKLFSTIKSIRAKVGILSLSERYDSLPMWAHYADLGRGNVAVLDNLSRSFHGDETGSLNIPKPVVYTERFMAMTFDPSTQDRLFFCKLLDWSYEREWRVVTSLDACQRSPDSGIYLQAADPDHLTGVICGWRVGERDISELRDRLSE